MFEQSRERSVLVGGHRLGGSALSMALHIVGGAGVLLAAQTASTHPPRATTSTPAFVMVSMPAPPPHERTVVPMKALKPLIRPKTTESSPKEPDLVPKLIPERKLEVAEHAVPIVPKPPPARIERADTPAPKVTVGSFASNAPPPATLNRNRPVDPAGFDAPALKGVDAKQGLAVTGGFENAAPAKPDAGRATGSVVADSGFGRTAAATNQPATGGTVRSTGFGSASDAPRGEAPRTAAVQQSGFSAAPPPPKTATVVNTRTVDTPMEVLSKPAPPYTDEARALKIEGDVLLDVEFCATGKVRVLGIKKGLGHGLDETASRAAEQIKFKPAQKDGQAVDFRATVYMTFRLT